MAIHQTASLALERLLLHAHRHVDVIPDARHVLLVQYQPSLRSVHLVQAEHAAPPCQRERQSLVKVTTS